MLSPRLGAPRRSAPEGFTLAEVVVAILIAALFGAAAFATNQRLLLALKAQRETTAASMMLQERMETLRGLAYSNVASDTYIGSNVISSPTTSEGALGSLIETITVSAYPADASTSNQWVRNSTYPTGHQNTSNSTLSSSYNLVKADILVSWTSADGRTRSRDLAAVFGIGNLGP